MGTRLRSCSTEPPVLLDRLEHPFAVTAAAFSDDGRRLVTAGGPSVRVWSRDGTLLEDIAADRVVRVDVDAHGDRVVTADTENRVRVWSMETGERLLELPGHDGRVTAVSFDPSGRLLLTAAEDDATRVWDAETGMAVATLDGHTDDVLAAEFSPDGSSVATASLDGDAALWDAETGDQLRVLRGHFNPVYAITFDPSGRWIVTGSQRTAGLWPESSGLLAAYLRGHEEPVTTVELASTGLRVLTASEDGTVRTWTCDTCGVIPELLALADARLTGFGRELTDDERDRYVG